jgi:hypothetical protein
MSESRTTTFRFSPTEAEAVMIEDCDYRGDFDYSHLLMSRLKTAFEFTVCMTALFSLVCLVGLCAS